MLPLPIDSLLPELCQKLRASRSLVLVAPPGAGKTTRVPPALLAANLLSPDHPNLVMLQPRRVAARAAAQRIADENHWQLGNEVGYHIRFEKRVQPTTRLRVLTEGILTRQLIADPFLEGIGAVLLDEFHERSLHTDLALALLKEIQSTVRPDLLLVVMSATLHAQPVANYLNNAPILESQGRLFPVSITHFGSSNNRLHLSERVATAVENVIANSANSGDILVFLPGAPEIHRTQKRLEPLAAQHNLLVLPLHGTLPVADQNRALAPAPPPFRQKIILATNIAETSLTIEGVTTVIDSGLARVASYDPRRGLDRLDLQRISRASATQRAGRAGRLAPGNCLRLWSQSEDRHLAEYDTPEIRRVDLASTVLALHAWGKPDPRLFPWFEPPAEETLLAAEKLLTMLGAISPPPNNTITPLGRQMLSLPTHPRLARLLLAAAEHGVLHEGCTIAAFLSEKDILRSISIPGARRAPTTQGPSDLLWRLDLLTQLERSKFHSTDDTLDIPAARQIARTRDELLHLTRRLRPQDSPTLSHSAFRIPHSDLLLQLPLFAYPDRVVHRRPPSTNSNDASSGLMVGSIGVRLAPESIVRQADFYLALDAHHDERNPNRESTVRIASQIDPAWLQQLFPHEIRRVRSVTYDPTKDRVIPLNQLFYRDLLLEEDRHGNLDPTLAAAALLDAARPQIRDLFLAHESAARLLQRLTFLKSAAPEHPWPTLDDQQLTEALTPLLANKRSLADLRAAPLDQPLRHLLPYPLDHLLNDLAPETITVPSGSKIKVDYSNSPPILAVRLQELFGLTQSPRLAAGRVPLLLHLLSPGYKPVQVTTDLASFWANAYFQVRKDLRTRYPKHSWPENPLHAPPVAKGRPRK